MESWNPPTWSWFLKEWSPFESVDLPHPRQVAIHHLHATDTYLEPENHFIISRLQDCQFVDRHDPDCQSRKSEPVAVRTELASVRRSACELPQSRSPTCPAEQDVTTRNSNARVNDPIIDDVPSISDTSKNVSPVSFQLVHKPDWWAKGEEANVTFHVFIQFKL